jgi:hypothetical protein
MMAGLPNVQVWANGITNQVDLLQLELEIPEIHHLIDCVVTDVRAAYAVSQQDGVRFEDAVPL